MSSVETKTCADSTAASAPAAPGRRGFLTTLGAVTAGVALGQLAGCAGGSSLPAAMGASNMDATILGAAATAEALASVMYDNIIKTSPAYARLKASGNINDQAYLVAGREQEAIHYATLVGAGGVPLATTFYFPNNMFSDSTFATTINTLVTLEDTFIAAYLIAIRDFSSNGTKELAGQILGVEAEHRAFARVIAADLGLASTTGQSGVPELVNGPSHAANNLAYERTFSNKFNSINDIVNALKPFVTAGDSGFSPTPYAFNTTANYYLSESPTVTLDRTTP